LTYKCYAGCGKFAVLSTKNKHQVPMCPKCRKDKLKCAKARYAWFDEKKRARDEAEMVSGTENLPQEEAYTPLKGEKLVLKMLRGEW
jgi:NAD-dependent SIR2 family protein deacetylase